MDTYFEPGHRDDHLFIPPDMLFFCFLGVDGWERVVFITFRKERTQPACIAGAEGVEPLLGDLQLGSARIDVDHHERAGVIIVDGCERVRESGDPGDSFL